MEPKRSETVSYPSICVRRWTQIRLQMVFVIARISPTSKCYNIEYGVSMHYAYRFAARRQRISILSCGSTVNAARR